MKVLFKSALFFVLVHGTCFAQVGIGTTSPVNKFEVETAAAAPLTSGVGFNGNLRLGATGANQVLDFGLGTTYGWIQSRDKTAYGTNYNLLLNPNGGRVGVGTNDPQSIFHVKNGYMRLEYSLGPYLDFMHSSGSTDQKIRRIGTYNGDMIFDKVNDAYTTSNEQMRITSTGNVGIGTTSPSTTLHVAQNNGAITLTRADGTYGTKIVQNHTIGEILYQIGLNVAGTYRTYMRVGEGEANPALALQPAGGNVGIGTTSPNNKLSVEHAGQVFAEVINTSSTADAGVRSKNSTVDSYFGANATGAYINTASNHPIVFYTNNATERMRITSGGNVGIRTTVPAHELDVVGVIRCSTLVQLSDMRFKNISETISSDDSISTIRYEWKDGRDDRVHIGYGAQEVERILPDAVYTDAEGLKAVNYDEVHTYKIMQLEQMVKELQQQNAELKKLISRKRRIRQ